MGQQHVRCEIVKSEIYFAENNYIFKMPKKNSAKPTVGKSSAKHKSTLDKPGKSKSHHSLNPNRKTDGLKGVGNPRTAGTIKRLQMYRCSKAKRDKDGKIIRPAPFQSYVMSGTQARVEPSRSWFSNTKVISQNALQKFQDDMKKAMSDPYQVVLRKTELPVSLLNEKAKFARVHLLETESFESTFGKKSKRKRPNINSNSLEELVQKAETASESYIEDKDVARVTDEPEMKDAAREYIFAAGKSKRIWNELYKVIDSSDVILQVLDARDPLGTRSNYIEQYLKKEKAHKHLVLVLNKVDLVPTWVTQKWVAILSQQYPTVAFHASIKHPFGKGALINLLSKVKREYMTRTYKIGKGWKDPNDFLEKVAQKYGKLLKGGEPDVNTIAKMILNDWQRGKIPFFVPPPGCELPPKKPEDKDEKNDDQDFSQIKVVHEYDEEDMQFDENSEKKENPEENTKKRKREDSETETKPDDKKLEIMSIEEQNENEVDNTDSVVVEDSKKRKREESETETETEKAEVKRIKTSSGTFVVTDQ